MEDSTIVDLYWARSDLAISESEQKYGRYCHTIAYNICGTDQDAEECVNDTWLRAWESMPTERPAILSSYLGRITRNLAIDRIKERTRQKRGGGAAALALDELSECVPGGTEPERSLEEKELEAVIGRFVAGLPQTEKTAFILRYWYLAPLEEIADRLRSGKGRIKSILFRTRKKLAAYLKEEGLC